MVTDRQYRDLLARFDELSQKYARMSQEIAAIKMRLDITGVKPRMDEPQQKKDVTRFIFKGHQLNKRQLVLECVKQYIADNGITCAQSLLEVFPDHIQGSLGVIRPIEMAEQYRDAPGHYFFGDNDVLHLDEGIYVICKDWTVTNINRFIDTMETLGYSIKFLYRN